ILYTVFTALDFTQPYDPVFVKYACVVLCFAVACVSAILSRGKKDAIFLALALGFTVISDLFIFVINDFYEVGLATFIVAQSLYFCRLYIGRKRWYISLSVRVAVAAVAVGVALAKLGGGLLIAEVGIYITMLVANLVDALILCRRGWRFILFAIGLFLFVCCDICVGLFNFGKVLNVQIPLALYNFAKYGMWAFYVPSQVCIVLSGRRIKGKKNERKAEENS
ncbi:MAG: hypothetical protein K2N47_03135, partial [Clostridia bacterium]|nr:hypothetical protein [Clostridia bacterium]